MRYKDDILIKGAWALQKNIYISYDNVYFLEKYWQKLSPNYFKNLILMLPSNYVDNSKNDAGIELFAPQNY